MGGPILPSVPQRRLPEPRRLQTKADQTLQQSLGPWTTFWRPASVRGPRFILCVSKDWCLDKILFQYLFLSSDSPQSSFKLKIHWVLAESSPWSWCSRLQRLVDWGKSKNTSPFLSKFFFVLILWAIRMVSVALQPGSIHCLSIHSWVLLLSWEPHVCYWVVKEL